MASELSKAPFLHLSWLQIENVAAISWIGLFPVSAILAVQLSWSPAGRTKS